MKQLLTTYYVVGIRLVKLLSVIGSETVGVPYALDVVHGRFERNYYYSEYIEAWFGQHADQVSAEEFHRLRLEKMEAHGLTEIDEYEYASDKYDYEAEIDFGGDKASSMSKEDKY